MSRFFTGAMATALLLTAMPAAAQSDTYLIDPRSATTINLRLCGQEVRVLADGDDDSDIDFVLTDAGGRIVHSDDDETDMMIALVRPPSPCGNYRLRAANLGGIANLLSVTLTTVRPWARTGSEDGRNRRVSIHNHTAETFHQLYFSNTADGVWGEDRLGSGVMRARTSRTFDMTDGTGSCYFDVKVVTASRREYTRNNVNACTLSTLEFGTEITH